MGPRSAAAACRAGSSLAMGRDPSSVPPWLGSACCRSGPGSLRADRFRAVGDHVLLRGWTEVFGGGTIGAGGRGGSWASASGAGRCAGRDRSAAARRDRRWWLAAVGRGPGRHRQDAPGCGGWTAWPRAWPDHAERARLRTGTRLRLWPGPPAVRGPARHGVAAGTGRAPGRRGWHAAALFGVATRDDIAGALLDPSFAILHGLYWLCANLGRRCPLLLCIDDVHWADQASLRFLHFLGRRLEELPVAVVAAERAGGGRAGAARAGGRGGAGVRGGLPPGDRRGSVPGPGARPRDR